MLSCPGKAGGANALLAWARITVMGFDISGTVARFGAVLRIGIPAAVAIDTIYSSYRVSQLYKQRLKVGCCYTAGTCTECPFWQDLLCSWA